MAPSKPTEPGLDGFVGPLSAESPKTCALGFQSIHRRRFAGLSAGVLIPTPPDSLHTGAMGAHRRVPIHWTSPAPIRHHEGLPPPASQRQASPDRSILSGTHPGTRRIHPSPLSGV